jgi:hypothetical protein
MSKMVSHCSFGHLKHKLWAKEGPGVELPRVCQFWLPTTNSQESTRNAGLQMTCDIPLESSRRELQLCFRLRHDPRSARKVMRLQSRGSLGWRSFGTPTRESWESRDKKAISMWAPWRGVEYTIGSKVVTYSWGPGRGESCVSKCPWLVPTPKGVPECELTTLWFVLV